MTPLLTGEEVCNILRVTRRTLYNRRRKGLIPYIAFERSILYDPRVIDRLITERTFDHHHQQGYGE